MLESHQIERNSSFGKEVIISLVAFANSAGGRVVIGIDDKGNVCGVEIGPETIQRYFNEIKVATYPQVTPQVILLLSAMDGPASRRELQDKLDLQDREHFRKEYLQPALQAGVIEMTKPDNPRAADQKYFLTDRGKDLIGRNSTAGKRT